MEGMFMQRAIKIIRFDIPTGELNDENIAE
jgi:hypothetical protein